MLPSDDRGKWVSGQIITSKLSKLRLSEVTALSDGIKRIDHGQEKQGRIRTSLYLFKVTWFFFGMENAISLLT